MNNKLRIKSRFAILAGRGVSLVSRLFNLGSGYAWAGLVARKIDPKLLRHMIDAEKIESIVVTGTNGKTSTSKMINNVFKEQGFKTIRNRSGANLLNGITGAMVTNANKSKDGIDKAIFEIDELALKGLVEHINPKYLVVTNFSRDQLDRYGEVDSIAESVKEGIRRMPKDASLILNADDPRVAYLGEGEERKVLYFGIEDERQGQAKEPNDLVFCLGCKSVCKYNLVYYGFLGKYICENCNSKRPDPNVSASEIEILDGKTRFTTSTPQGKIDLTMNQSGLHVVHNALAVTAVGLLNDVSLEKIKTGLEKFHAAFGRGEVLDVGKKRLGLKLIKNPVSFNQMLSSERQLQDAKGNLLIMINDGYQDGRDISWLWDVDFEEYKDKVKNVIVAGSRALDMALRLKYAGYDMASVKIYPKPEEAIEKGLENVKDGETLTVYPNYTAMLQTRKVLVNKGLLKQIWES